MAWGFHYDDVDPAVVARDLDDFPARHGDVPPWGSATVPATVALWCLAPGAVLTEAAGIRSPVLVALGERDVLVDPRGEPRAYESARSVDLFVCPKMGHMHNFAGTRELMWRRIETWAAWVGAVRDAQAGRGDLMDLEMADDLATLLTLERVDRDLFRGLNANYGPRQTLFGGQVAAECLLAAAGTVEPDRLPHSFHGYFLRAGRVDLPVIFEVDRDRDGRSFSARHVVAVQDGEVIFSMITSFHVEADGAHFDEAPRRDAPEPRAGAPQGVEHAARGARGDADRLLEGRLHRRPLGTLVDEAR